MRSATTVPTIILVEPMIVDESGWPTLDVSRFYNIEPMGLGTLLVESLSSYVARLAAEHLVNASNLAVHEIGPHLTHVRLRSDSAVIGSHKSVSHMNGNSLSAVEWANALEQLTRRKDIRCLTLLPFANLFSDKDSLKHSRSWCPSCLNEWQVKELTLYEPLIWCIKAVKLCPQHHEPLVSNCPHCGSSSLVLAPRVLPGYCTHCEGWLGYTTSSPIATEEIEYPIWSALEIGELLAGGSAKKQQRSGIIPSVLNFLIAKRIKRDGIQALAKLLEISPYKLHQWQTGECLPGLNDLLWLCWLFKLKLVELEAEANSWEKFSGYDERVAETENQMSLNRSRTDWMKTEKLLHDVIVGNLPPMRVKDIARTIGCNSVHMYKRYPDLCKMVTTLYARHKREYHY